LRGKRQCPDPGPGVFGGGELWCLWVKQIRELQAKSILESHLVFACSPIEGSSSAASIYLPPRTDQVRGWIIVSSFHDAKASSHRRSLFQPLSMVRCCLPERCRGSLDLGATFSDGGHRSPNLCAPPTQTEVAGGRQ